MMVVILIAGIGCLLAGLVAIGFGIPVKEFSFGNTLILAGAVAACTGLIMLGLWSVVRELQGIAERLGSGMSMDDGETTLQPTAVPAAQRHPADAGDVPFDRDQSFAEQAGYAEPATHPAAALRGELRPMPEPVEAPSAPKPRRNLMFSSTSRRERERAQARSADQSATGPVIPPPVAEASEQAGIIENPWPKSERARSADTPLQRRSGRAPSTFNEPSIAAERSTGAGGNEDHPPITVLKSGVVDGMAYSLYSDGSIEAQMPEGMMRFASIDELRAHLDQRP
jgi:hypothetical protein